MSKGRIIAGRYRIKQRLGRGNFGVVWEADELLGGEPVGAVAVKVFTAEVDRREIALLAGLSHPSILGYRAVVEDDDEVCLVTELADGGDAAGRLKAWPDGLPAMEVRDIVRSVAGALAHLHEQGWVHRDVKPANILFVKGRPKLGDVGTARALTSTARATSTASLAYAAPEFFSGHTGPSVDTYALGCTAYELLTGRLPFDGTMSEIVSKHLTAEIAFPSDMPPDLVALIRGSTTKEPERRWTLARILEAMTPREEAKPPAEPAPVRPQPTSAPPISSTQRTAEASPPAPQAAPPPATPPPSASKPTPLDPALRRHLGLHGERWGDAEVWRAFMQTAAAAAGEHGLGERDLIRRGSQLFPEVRAANTTEMERIAQIGAWVVNLRGGRWTAPDWADLLDRLNAPDDAAMARHRDGLIARIYPSGAGATRALDLGEGVLHLLVYSPLDHLDGTTAVVAEALRLARGGGEVVAGVWYSARPLTVRECAALAGMAIPAGTEWDKAAVQQRPLADKFLAAAQRRFPTEELRWPYMSEYGGIKGKRQEAVTRAAAQGVARTGASPARGRPGFATPTPPTTVSIRRSPPQSLGAAVAGVLGKAVGKAATTMLKELNETWLTDPPGAQNPEAKLAMNLVSPVPKVRR